MSDNKPLDYDHLLANVQTRFPNGSICLNHTDDEIIHIDVDGHRFTFEIGSDDDFYLFTDGVTSFKIPLMEWE